MLSLIVASAFNTDLFECALCLLVKYLLVCIATNTPEDGRVVDETWLLAVAALHAAHSLNTQLWAPLSAAKPAYFLNYTPLLKSGRFLFCFFSLQIVTTRAHKSYSEWHLAK